MKALLVFNPEATTVTPRVRDVIAHALDDVVALEVAETKRRDHATEIARNAAASGVEMIFCLGGDGTLNETLNGVAGTGVTLGVLSGGGTNVFARTLGLPRDPVEATAVLIEKMREGAKPRILNLGNVNGRHFAFCAGVGFDAEVVQQVHEKFKHKQRFGETFFVVSAVRTFFLGTDRRMPALTVTLPDGRTINDVYILIAGKSDPFTFLGSRPLRLTPGASLDGGLDATAVKTMKTAAIIRAAGRGFSKRGLTRGKNIDFVRDVDGFDVRASRPIALQLDGEYIGEAEHFTFSVERDALSVLC
ncbi:MAG: diacylglycerol kinase family protein [Actinomycetota bacterium]|nr:diacylglycerol kinase family lipid kinase [Actinomycetota bacterium]